MKRACELSNAEDRLNPCLRGALESDAGAEVPESPRLATCWRAWLDDAAVLRTHFVDRAWVTPRLRNVEASAATAGVLHKPKVRGLILEIRINREESLPKAGLVCLEQMHRSRSVMAAATAFDAVRALGIGLAWEGQEPSSCGS